MASKIRKELRIVFMGTPEFAVPSLQILVENGYNIVGVVTATDKFGGRGGKQLIASDIKKYAEAHQLRILQPKNLKGPDFIDELQSLNANVQIVVAFRMLPEVVWDMPEFGTYNLHGSLLPKFRGAAPINWAIINGETETGVTSFKLKHEIDTGDILFQEKLDIGPEETAGELYERLKILGSEVVLKTIKAIETDDVHLTSQDSHQITKAPKIHYETCQINFAKTPLEIHNFVRGMNPYPGAWMNFFGNTMKIFKVKQINSWHNAPPGTIDTDNKFYLRIAVKNGWIEVLDLQIQGKKRMDVRSYLNGNDIRPLLESNP